MKDTIKWSQWELECCEKLKIGIIPYIETTNLKRCSCALFGFAIIFPIIDPKSKSLSHTFGTYWQKTISQSPLDLENVERVLPNQIYKRWQGSDDIELPKQYKLHRQTYHKRHWKTEIFRANMDSATLHQCYLCYPCHPYPCWDFFFL